MIRLRTKLERARAHPILGPIVLILLVLVLAMVFLHTAMDNHESASEVGVLCMAVLVLLGPLLIDRVRRAKPLIAVIADIGRGPPPPAAVTNYTGAVRSGFTLPLRR